MTTQELNELQKSQDKLNKSAKKWAREWAQHHGFISEGREFFLMGVFVKDDCIEVYFCVKTVHDTYNVEIPRAVFTNPDTVGEWLINS